jgi:TctA family transporter
MVVLGLFLGLIGTDIASGQTRFTFGISALADGVGFVPVAMGLFGIAEVIAALERGGARQQIVEKISRLWPTREEARLAWPAVLRGTGIGSLLGVLPGGGALISAFAAYVVEKKIAKDPSRFGQGAIEGVAAPESANNAGAQTSFIPLLAMGIPPNPVMALMLGAMTIHGIVPGPKVMTERPDLFWGMIASMWLGNLILIIINLPLIGIWVKFLQIPYRWLYSVILVFCCIGVFTVNNTTTDVLVMAVFGLFGYLLIKIRCEPAPLLLGFVLGPLMEENLRRAMLIARGDPTVFMTRPISATLLAIAFILIVLAGLPKIRRRRDEVFVEE